MARAPQAARRRPPPAQAVPTGLWIMVGGVLVLFIGILLWLGTRPAQAPGEVKQVPLQVPAKPVVAEPKPVQKDVREVRTEEPVKAAKPPVPPPPRYDFYQMLPEQSVGTPAPPAPDVVHANTPLPAAPTDMPPVKTDRPPEVVKEVASLPPAVDKAKAASPAGAPQVILQVGSFRRYEEADRRKAELALLGYAASVQAANVNGETWHRVKIGPLPDADARKLRDRLKAVGMNPLLVKGG